MIKLLSADLNFTVAWVQVMDISYGTYNEVNDTWDGNIRLIIDNEADLSNAYLAVTESRSSFVSFTPGFSKFECAIFMLQPRPLSTWTTYFEVFNNEHWLCLLLLAGFLGVIWGVCFYVIQEGFQQENFILTRFKSLTRKLCSGEELVLISFTSQDVSSIYSYKVFNRTSIKILFLVTFLFGLINTYFYNARLTSALVTSHYHSEIKS
jgi:hypothetical protein